ncbi:glycerophosphodiester phosphodiesterase [Sphingomonas sp. CGMCC 1.13654]|uniref:glycerophosphodiester phosphodiesterase n=1 Tax=Sphingomonas chungangi TaxID=2683589 RepID=A0A838L620_9SPHN|nr:glycerophosphodiester phosphodiesterase family protein [Sphingomonas chungangi]MBA2934943.1 glycerophosphodiester phosphodiesterase [Sphingomonas chungangi]MVW58254.1 glycerophosphodiester phosphodiesterase [Sphingomonas chungangi]
MDISRRRMLGGTGAAWLVASNAAGQARAMAAPERKILIYGHRGASALRPEHTLASYAKAIEDGADFIEPDLCATKDGHLIIRHENNIVETTDIASHPEFAGRRTGKVVDGERQVGWFTEDFTLAELKTLRAKERLGQIRTENAKMDGWFDLVTWEEMIDFCAAESLARGRTIGLVPEIKHSTYFASVGLPMEDRFLDTLGRHWQTRTRPLVIQSFEIANLKYIRQKLGRPGNVQLMQLTEGIDDRPADVVKAGGTLTFNQMMEPAGLADIARYADILAPDTRTIIPLGPNKRLAHVSPVTADAHKAGLLVQPWTFRPENTFLAADFQNGDGLNARNPAGSLAEIKTYIAAGIDGFFTDDPAIGRAAIGRPPEL